MNVYIAVDMESITGVVNWEETTAGKADYERFRRLMTAEADADAYRAARALMVPGGL